MAMVDEAVIRRQRFERAKTRALQLLNRQHHSETQPRDEQGRFSSTGGGGGNGGGTPIGWLPVNERPKDAKHPGPGYSKNAYRTSDGVIHTNDIHDAQRALYEGEKISLDQPRTLSTLMDRLHVTAQDMINKGEKAPLVDLCNVSVKGTNLFCAETLGIPRVEMPQFPPGQEEKFVEHLAAQGHKFERGTELASNLKATQNQLDGVKVAGMAAWLKNAPDKRGREIIVDQSGYVLDGHHFWAAMVGLESSGTVQNLRLNVSRVDMNITQLLEEAHKFTGGVGRVGFGHQRMFPKWLVDLIERQHHSEDQPRDEQGRFSSTGGAGGGSGTSATSTISTLPTPSTPPTSPSVGRSPTPTKFTRSDFKAGGIDMYSHMERSTIERWNKDVRMAPAEFKQKYLGGMKGEMDVSSTPGGIKIDGVLKDDTGKEIGIYESAIDFDLKEADCGSLEFDDDEQAKGHATRFVLGQVNMYREMGMNKATMLANFDVGGYAWARYGVVPTRMGWADVKEQMEERMSAWPSGFATPQDEERLYSLMTSDPKNIWKIADDRKYGKALLLDTTWQGEVRLRDPEVMTRFINYLGRRRT